MVWLFSVPLAVLACSVVWRFPQRAAQMALRNTRRGNGVRSQARTRRELRHGGRLAWHALGIPLLVLVLAAGGMRVVHLYIMPDTTLADIYGDQHPELALNAPDLDAWADRIEADRRDQAYQQWRQAQGLDPIAKTSWQHYVSEHWPMHLAFPILLLVFVAWYALRILPRIASAYGRGVLSRSREYLHRDLKTKLD